MKETIARINELYTAMRIDLDKAESGNKAAAARARKMTLEMEKLCRDFRRRSIDEMK